MIGAVLFALASLAVAELGSAYPRLDEHDLGTISPSVVTVVTGGHWSRDDGHVYSRLIITQYDWAEFTTKEVFVQWLRLDWPTHSAVVEHTAKIVELTTEQINPDSARHLPADHSQRFGQTFSVDAHDCTFTITPHLDHSYSVTRSFLPPRVRDAAPVLSAILAGVVLLIAAVWRGTRSLRMRSARPAPASRAV